MFSDVLVSTIYKIYSICLSKGFENICGFNEFNVRFSFQKDSFSVSIHLCNESILVDLPIHNLLSVHVYFELLVPKSMKNSFVFHTILRLCTMYQNKTKTLFCHYKNSFFLRPFYNYYLKIQRSKRSYKSRFVLSDSCIQFTTQICVSVIIYLPLVKLSLTTRIRS